MMIQSMPGETLHNAIICFHGADRVLQCSWTLAQLLGIHALAREIEHISGFFSHKVYTF